MPRNMSFSHTTDQFRDRTKGVTRRRGWKFLKPGEILNGCVKCMGLRPGEKIERLGQIRVTSVRRERLAEMCECVQYGEIEARLEGFNGMSGQEFVEMFCKEIGGTMDQVVTRIEYEYLEPPS